MSSFQTHSESSKSTRTTGGKFPQKIRQNGIIHGPQAEKPDDFDDIRKELDRARESGSPDSEVFRSFQQAVHYAPNEATFKSNAFDTLRKPIEQCLGCQYIRVDDHEWSDVCNSSLTKGCSKPKPDLVECYAMDPYPTNAIETLGSHLQPSSRNFSMPYIAMELKGPNGGAAQGRSQAAYDGALMTEAALEQQRYLGLLPEYGKTQALSIYASTEVVEVQTNHARQNTEVKYYNNPAFTIQPHASRESFSAAYRNVRNAQMWSRARADAMLEALRNHTNTGIPTPSSPSFRTVELGDQRDIPHNKGPQDREEGSDGFGQASIQVKTKANAKRTSTTKRMKV